MKKNYVFKWHNVLILLCFLIVKQISAQNFTILTNGTSYNCTTCYPAPYGNWYGSSTHQMFVSAAELTNAGITAGASIKSIGFNIYSLNGAAPHQNWKMTVYTTSLADPIASAPVSSGVVATSTLATVTGTIGWNQTQVSPFIWNGVDNLVIETCFFNPTGPNTTSYTYNYSTYYTTTLTGTSTKVRYYYEDNVTSCLNQNTSPTPGSGTSTNTRPDMRFEWYTPPPCSSVPFSNSIVVPTVAICPNSSVNLGLANGYTVSGITYQWQSSTVSAVGPYTAIGSATSPVFATPNLTTSTFYNLVVTCTNVAGSTTTSAGQVSVSPVITNSVPYSESFEGITAAGKLPNCSWAISSTTTCLTYTSSNTLGRIPRTGTNFASFYYSPAGANYFYTNGIYLNAGITYSAALWYETEYYGYNNWTDLSILYGTTQTTTGLVSIVSSNGPAVSNVYKRLANTFTVATSGLYYIAVRATAASGSAQFLTWDDLSITIPCTANSPNTPSISLLTNTATICMGDMVTINASGANTYTWTNNGSNSNSITDTPMTSVVYTVAGTNSLTGCMSTVYQAITVNTVPTVFVAANPQNVCSGNPVALTALGNGNSSFGWSNGSNGPNITVTPTVSTTYTVVATGANGCSGSASQMVTVNALPTISVTSSSPNQMCTKETAILTAAGTGVSYQWLASGTGMLASGNPLSISPNVTTIYTVTATDNHGCQKSTTIVQNVSDCTGIAVNSMSSGMSLYPNPNSGEFSIESNSTAVKTIQIMDLTGKVVSVVNSDQPTVKVNMSDLSNGIYYVRVKSDNATQSFKVVKQ